jgi:hypothetical protein
MTTNSSAKSVALIAFLVFVARQLVKASSINELFHHQQRSCACFNYRLRLHDAVYFFAILVLGLVIPRNEGGEQSMVCLAQGIYRREHLM